MPVIEKLATSLDRRDEEPNKELASHIAQTNDSEAVAELVQLQHKNRNIQSDSIKTLYELGGIKPALISPYVTHFVLLLQSKNNRMVWGAMAALSAVASINPELLYQHLTTILDAAAKGSVIAKDHANRILVHLTKTSAYTSNVLALLIDQLKDAPLNQLPAYAENTATVVTDAFKPELLRVLQERLPEVEQESKRKRLEKVLKKLQK